MTVVILDNEAIQVILQPHHPKFRAVASRLEAARWRSANHTRVTLHVPATVQVEAGWDRTSPTSVQINRYPITISALDSPSADAAARIVAAHSVTPADAHVGVLCQKLAAQDARVIVLTSDPDDIELVASPTTITALRI
jgi:hypothetical protein